MHLHCSLNPQIKTAGSIELPYALHWIIIPTTTTCTEWTGLIKKRRCTALPCYQWLSFIPPSNQPSSLSVQRLGGFRTVGYGDMKVGKRGHISHVASNKTWNCISYAPDPVHLIRWLYWQTYCNMLYGSDSQVFFSDPTRGSQTFCCNCQEIEGN